MNCFVHDRTAAIGICSVCQKAMCHQCVAREQPRLVCRSCIERRTMIGFEYRSSASIGGWPLLHICAGLDPATMRPRVARGVIAIGNIAVGAVALGGLSFGLLTFGGVSLGLLFALGGLAIGVGLSIGGVAIGSIAFGGLAVGLAYAMGGVAIAPAVIDGHRCDAAMVDLVRQWFGPGLLPPTCR